MVLADVLQRELARKKAHSTVPVQNGALRKIADVTPGEKVTELERTVKKASAACRSRNDVRAMLDGIAQLDQGVSAELAEPLADGVVPFAEELYCS